MSNRILALCGRLRSGKGSLADICEKYGYKRIYFALPLKKMCAEFLDISIDELNRIKNDNTELNITLGDDAVYFFSEETDIPRDIVKKIIYNKTIKNARELLQFIGTDLIRSYNMNWHVERLGKLIEPNQKYVFEDLRFPNEKQFIEDVGGDCWFVVRPKLDNISHHISEEAINWQMFGDKIIVNNKSLSYLELTWENFLLNYDAAMKKREKNIAKLSILNEKEKNDKAFSIEDSLLISPYLLNYQKIDFDKNKIKNIEQKDENVVITMNDDSMMYVHNPLNIEDLKFIV